MCAFTTFSRALLRARVPFTPSFFFFLQTITVHLEMERLTNAEEEAYSNLAVLNKINATK